MTRLQEIKQELEGLACLSTVCIIQPGRSPLPCMCNEWGDSKTGRDDIAKALRLRAEQVALLKGTK